MALKDYHQTAHGKERICELEDRSIETLKTESQREARIVTQSRLFNICGGNLQGVTCR